MNAAKTEVLENTIKLTVKKQTGETKILEDSNELRILGVNLKGNVTENNWDH